MHELPIPLNYIESLLYWELSIAQALNNGLRLGSACLLLWIVVLLLRIQWEHFALCRQSSKQQQPQPTPAPTPFQRPRSN